MDVRTQSQDGPTTRCVEDALQVVRQQLLQEPSQWLKDLRQQPEGFADLEQKVHHVFQAMADRVVAGLLAEATGPTEFANAAEEKVKSQAPQKKKLRSGEPRRLSIRLLGGLMIFVSTMYCGPSRRTGKGRGREGSGLYPELSVLGIQEGKTPALVREVGRLSALLPSYELARQELEIHGVDLDIKEVHGIGQQAGESALVFRLRELEEFRAGTLPAGDGAGKRLGAMIDGGRVKVRRTTRKQKGRGKKKTQTRRFKTVWREPKQIIVFEMDEEGRTKAGSKPMIDGTLQGPDEVMEILAMRLHQAGASQAEVVAFRADGAPWIWDRLDWVIRRLDLTQEQVSKGLDFYHVSHHVSLVLGLSVADAVERKRLSRKLRKWLRQGSWPKVVGELLKRASEADLAEDSAAWTSIAYVERHGEAGHLEYAKYRRRGLPLGSGAIESTIRRVINLRLKGNGIYWLEENAEAMLRLRGLVLGGRWEEEFAKMTASLGKDRERKWQWKSPDMVAALESPAEIMSVKAQRAAQQAGCAAAA